MNMVIVASAGRCGIYEYSLILKTGFEENGHTVCYIGVKNHDNQDLMRRISEVQPDDDVVIFEYEPGIFWLGGIIRAMFWLRFWRRKRVILSVHEIAPEKFPEARQIQWHLGRHASSRGRLWELLTLIPATADVLLRFVLLRLGWLVMGALPHTILIHSIKGKENIRLIVPDDKKVGYTPLLVTQLNTDAERVRSELNLPKDAFVFIMHGFLFRRKRIVQVISQLPEDVELWVVGTESEYDPGYLPEIEEAVKQIKRPQQVKIIQDYERMEQYLQAADVAVLYYTDGFQSAAASLAIGAGKPCIFSNISAFSDLKSAGLTVDTPQELHTAMQQIRQPAIYNQLKDNAMKLRQALSPGMIAKQYLNFINENESPSTSQANNA